MKLVVATRNRGKLRELRELLRIDGVELLTLDDLRGVPEIEETGATFADNAVLKARAVQAACGLAVLADDSGLEVDALGGAPGVHSARYAGDCASDRDRVALLLANLRGVPPEQRTARFRCAAALAHPDGSVDLCEGVCEGRIIDQPRGDGGFGYDPVFFVEELGQTLAEIPAEQKNRISHRGRALAKMAELLRSRMGPVQCPPPGCSCCDDPGEVAVDRRRHPRCQ